MAQAMRVSGEVPAAGAATGAGSYDALLEVIRTVAISASADEAIEALFGRLHAWYAARAVALEITDGPMARFQAFGDPDALASGEHDPESRCHVCVFHETEVPGRITYVLPRGALVPAGLLEAATTQIALRLRHEGAFRRAEVAEATVQQRISEVATIYEIGRAIDRIELPDLLHMITHRAALLMDAQACSLMLLDEATNTLHVEASHGLNQEALAQERKIGEGLAGLVAQTGEPMLLAEDTRDPRLDGVQLRPEIRTSMLVPMKSQEGAVLGVLSIRRCRPALEFTDEDLKLFSVFATQAALALINVHLYTDLKRRANELLKLSTLSRVLIATLDLEERLESVVDAVRQVVGFERCCLFVRDGSRAAYVARVWRGYTDAVGKHPVYGGAVGSAAQAKMAISFDLREPVTPQQEREKSYLQRKGFARSLGTDAFVAVPILTSQNQCLGVIVADNKGGREPITSEQKSLLIAFANQAGISIENARLYEEMQENIQKIHRLKQVTENVLQSIGAGILATDAEGRIGRWNRVAEETLNRPPAFFQDILLTELIVRLPLPEAERAHLLELIEKVLETGQRLHLHKVTVHPRHREPVTLNLKVSPLMDERGQRTGVVCIFEDVTQEVRLEAEVDRMRRLADIGQLAARMAHEVRNALSPIKGAAQIIQSETGGRHAFTEWADIIVTEVNNLSHLTSAMLDFARPTALNPRPLQINVFLAGAIQSLASMLHDQRVRVTWQLHKELPEVQADPIHLGQAVRNLVINAMQAMPQGGDLQVATSFDARTNLLEIRIQDTGMGIAGPDLERIFRPFVTTKTKGTGLGLPIVQKIVNQHGGRVEVTSRVGAGTCFRLLLPLAPPHDLVGAIAEEAPLLSAGSADPFPDR